MCLRIARNNNQKSGTHDHFPNFIMGLQWILFQCERMEELGDNSSLYFNISYPSRDGNVFLICDGMTEAPGSQTLERGGSNSSICKKAKSIKNIELDDAKVMKDKTATQKNLSCSRLFEYTTSEMHIRLSYRAGEMDEIMATEDRLDEVEAKYEITNVEHLLNRVKSLKRKFSVLAAKDVKLSLVLQELSSVSSNN